MNGPRGALIEPATFRIERRLPGPVERVWAFLTDSKLRRQWLAEGEMTLVPGAPFELVWHNDRLTENPGTRPPGMAEVHRMQSRILEVEAPHRLVISWGAAGDVAFTLSPEGESVLLTVLHRRIPDRSILLRVAPGWHMHLDVLAAHASHQAPPPFWDGWSRLQAEYAQRIPE